MWSARSSKDTRQTSSKSSWPKLGANPGQYWQCRANGSTTLPQYDFRLMMFCGNDLRRKANVSSTPPQHELGSFEPYRVHLQKSRAICGHQAADFRFFCLLPRCRGCLRICTDVTARLTADVFARRFGPVFGGDLQIVLFRNAGYCGQARRSQRDPETVPVTRFALTHRRCTNGFGHPSRPADARILCSRVRRLFCELRYLLTTHWELPSVAVFAACWTGRSSANIRTISQPVFRESILSLP